MNSGFSASLNLARWAAAFLVVCSHVRNLIFLDLKDVPHPSVLIKLMYFVTGLGHEAVMLFFVLSGYLVGGLTLQRWVTSGTSFGHYFSARISRIFTVLVPALVLGCALDCLGWRFLNGTGIYTDPMSFHTSSLSTSILPNLSPAIFLGNLVMLEGITVPVLGSNGPLWSLAWEWWYYCLFALGAAAYLSRGRSSVIWAAMTLALAALLPFQLVLWGSIWLLGVVAHQWIRSGRKAPPMAVSLLGFIAAMVVSRLTHGIGRPNTVEPLWIQYPRDAIVAITFTLLLVSMSRSNVRVPIPNLQKTLAEFSYTTYLFHFPIMLILVALFADVFGVPFRGQPSVANIGYFLGIMGLLYGICFVISIALERRVTPALRRWLEKRFVTRSPSFGLPWRASGVDK